MFFDLNHPHEGCVDLGERYERLLAAISLGYSCIAHNHVVRTSIGADHRCPIKLLDPELALGGQDAVVSERSKELLKGRCEIQQLKRLTLITDDTSVSACLQARNSGLKDYDLVAILPESAEVAEKACASLDVDMISIDLTKFATFSYKQYWLRKGIERGIYIELSYSTALKDASDRRKFFRGARQFYDMTRGQNLIFSSGAMCGLEMRGPYDVINLATFVGLKEKHAKESISSRCAEIVKRSGKRMLFKGAVAIEVSPEDASTGVDIGNSGDRTEDAVESSGNPSSDSVESCDKNVDEQPPDQTPHPNLESSEHLKPEAASGPLHIHKQQVEGPRVQKGKERSSGKKSVQVHKKRKGNKRKERPPGSWKFVKKAKGPLGAGY